MKRKGLLMCVAVLMVLTAQVQIGYKGQIMASVDAGISQSGGCVATGRVGAYCRPGRFWAPE